MSEEEYSALESAGDNAEDMSPEASYGYLCFLANETIVQVNDTWLRWVGYEKEKVLEEMRFTDFLTKGGAMYFHMLHMPMLHLHKAVREFRYDIVRQNGEWFPVLIDAIPVKDDHGSLHMIKARIFDISA